MTTAASRSVKAGAPGFEPGIAGPKPAALPLGYAPKSSAAKCCSAPLGSPEVRKEVHERDDREGGDENERDDPDDEGQDHDE